MSTRTDKVPNTSATAASSGTDLNGAAVQDACLQIKARLAAVAAAVLDCEPADVRFDDGIASARGTSIEFSALCETAYKQRVPLFAEGFYRTPDIHFDFKTSRGRPFHYYAYGAAVSEVEVDGFTGQFRLIRTDILHDAGDSISPIVDRGQIEGGFLQGVGWLTLEELLWDAKGRVSTGGASTYKLPSWSEVPEVFNVEMLERATQPGRRDGQQGGGEPPLMLAFSVREAFATPSRRSATADRSPSTARPLPSASSSPFARCGAWRSSNAALSRSHFSHPGRIRCISTSAIAGALRLSRGWRPSGPRGARRCLWRVHRRFATRIQAPTPSTGAAGSSFPDSSTRTCIFRRRASSARWGGRCSTGSMRLRCRKRRGWQTAGMPQRRRRCFCARSRRTARRRRSCSARISQTRRPNCSRRPPSRACAWHQGWCCPTACCARTCMSRRSARTTRARC